MFIMYYDDISYLLYVLFFFRCWMTTINHSLERKGRRKKASPPPLVVAALNCPLVVVLVCRCLRFRSFSLSSLFPSFSGPQDFVTLVVIMSSFLGMELAGVHIRDIEDGRVPDHGVDPLEPNSEHT